MKSNVNYRVLALSILVSLLLMPVSEVQATFHGTTIYLPVAANGGVAQVDATAVTEAPVTLGHTLYLPLIAQEEDPAEAQVNAAWFNLFGFF